LRSIAPPAPAEQGRSTQLASRRRSALRGRRAERVAHDYFLAAGFEIVSRNDRFAHGEIDLVVRRGALLVAVEVRTRGPRSLEGPFASVTVSKRRRCRSALAALWKRHAADLSIRRVRFDVCAVYLDETPVRVEVAEGVSLG
jgi:putative endonuclease